MAGAEEKDLVGERASETSKTLIGLNNGNRRYIYVYIYIVRETSL